MRLPSVLILGGGNGSVQYDYALVDVGGPAAQFRVKLCSPNGASSGIPTSCPAGADCQGPLLPAAPSCEIRVGGEFLPDGRLLVLCGITPGVTYSDVRVLIP